MNEKAKPISQDSTQAVEGEVQEENQNFEAAKARTERYFHAQQNACAEILAAFSELQEVADEAVSSERSKEAHEGDIDAALRKIHGIARKERLYFDAKSFFIIDCASQLARQSIAHRVRGTSKGGDPLAFYLGRLVELFQSQLGGPDSDRALLEFAAMRAVDLLQEHPLHVELDDDDPKAKKAFFDGSPRLGSEALAFAMKYSELIDSSLRRLSDSSSEHGSSAAEVWSWIQQCGSKWAANCYRTDRDRSTAKMRAWLRSPS